MLFSIATLSVFLLAVGDLACGTRTLQVPAAGLHGRRHKARTNAEAIQLGEPLLKPRLVPCMSALGAHSEEHGLFSLR
jgi:hypothetical protein